MNLAQVRITQPQSSISRHNSSAPGGTGDGGLAQPLLALVLRGQHDSVPLRVLAPAEGVRVVVLNVQLLWDPIPDMNKGITNYNKKLFPLP